MRPPTVPAYCRVTVLAPARRVDVALPADVPLAELGPLVLELLGEPMRAPDRPDPWRFTGATGGPLPPGSSLDDLGVLDGEMLRFGPAVPPPPAPVFDDPVDALATLAPHRRPGGRWAAVAALGAAVAAAALVATVRAGGDAQAWSAVGLGALGAVAGLVHAARVARRRIGVPEPDAAEPDAAEPDAAAVDPAADPVPSRADPARTAAVVAASCAVPLAAAAGWAALPGSPGATHVLLAAVAGGTAAALGQLAVREVAPALVAATVVAVLTGGAAVVGQQFGVAVPALSAITAAVALSAGPLLPRVVLRLAGLPRPVVPTEARDLVAADAGPDLLAPAELAAHARLARGQLAGLSAGAAVVAAAAALTAVLTTATPVGWAEPTLVAVVAAVLLLRARGFADAGPAQVHLAAGLGAGIALVVVIATAAGPAATLGGLLVLLGAAAGGVGALGAGRRDGPPVSASPVARRALDLAEGVLTAAAVPVALAAAGVFALVRSL